MDSATSSRTVGPSYRTSRRSFVRHTSARGKPAAWGLVEHLDSVHIVARPLPNPLLHAWLVRNRSRLGQTIHPRRGGVRAALAALRAGESLVMLPDQNQRLRGLFIPVFGKLASCDRSQARLAQLAGAPIVLGAAIRVGRRFPLQSDRG